MHVLRGAAAREAALMAPRLTHRVVAPLPPLRSGVAKGDRVLLPEYGGQTVKLNDTECVAAAAAAALRRSERTPW